MAEFKKGKIQPRWYAVQVEAGEEIGLAEFISSLEEVDEAYCPVRVVIGKVSRHTSKFTENEAPIFRKYLFIRIDSKRWDVVTRLKLVDGFLSVDGRPLPISESVIRMIQRECDAGVYNDRFVEGVIKPGEEVAVAEGHWAEGMRGIFQGLLSKRKALVELSLFGRLTGVEIPAKLIEAIG